MNAWIRLLQRPLANHERAHALALMVLALIAAGTLLSLSAPPQPPPPVAAPRPPGTQTPITPPRISDAAEYAARAFLAGFLPYTEHQRSASAIPEVTRELAAALKAHPPLSSPAPGARRQRLLSLTPATGAAGRLALSALVNDGTLVDYRLKLLLTRVHGRLLVSALEAE